MSQKSDQEKVHSSDSKKIDSHTVRSLVIIFVLFVMIVSAFVFLRMQVANVSTDEQTYRYHYVFVGDTGDSRMLEIINDAAGEYGRKSGVYVEALDTGDESDSSYADRIDMAVAMGVNGIIVGAQEEKDIEDAIERASEEEIPVVTVLSDCPDSLRKAFIEPDVYDVGRTYARSIISVAGARKLNIAVLTGSDNNERFMAGLTDTLQNEGNHLDINIITEDITDMPNFRLMDLVAEMLTDDEMDIDMLLCPTEYTTQIVYQSVMDHNLAGRAQMIGYGINESLLRAVSNGEISALVYIDADQTGMECVDALTGYIDAGITRDHVTVESIMITGDNIGRYLDE